MSDLLEQMINVVALVRGKISAEDDIGPDDAEALIRIIERQHVQLVCARAYVDKSIASFDKDPADNDFQRGFLAAMEIVRDEAFAQIDDFRGEQK